MVKRLFHVLLALAFPFFVLIQLLFIVLFTDDGLGKKWFLDSNEMIARLLGNNK